MSTVISNEPAITPELVAEHGLKPDEYARILKLIGRVPTFTVSRGCMVVASITVSSPLTSSLT